MELAIRGGGSRRIRHDDLALQRGIQQILIAVDGDAQLGFQILVYDQRHVLDVEETVISIGIQLAQLIRDGGGVGLKNVVIHGAVGLEQTAEQHVSLRIVRFAARAGNQLADGIADPFDRAVRIILVPDVLDGCLLRIVQRGIHHDAISDRGGIIAYPGGFLLGDSCAAAQHEQGNQNQTQDFLHWANTPFSFITKPSLYNSIKRSSFPTRACTAGTARGRRWSKAWSRSQMPKPFRRNRDRCCCMCLASV